MTSLQAAALAALLVCLPLPLAAGDEELARARAEFRATWAAPGTAPADSRVLRDYVLYPYLESERLRWALSRLREPARDAALEDRIAAFLRRHREAPVTRDLRRDWLHFLGRRADWPALRAHLGTTKETAIHCYDYSARIAAGALDGLREAVLAQWLTLTNPPAACEAPFRWLDTRDRLNDEEIERRARFAARSRLPLPVTLAELPADRRALWGFWDRLFEHPERALKAFSAGAVRGLPDDPAVGEGLLAAFEDLARRDSTRARPLYGALAKTPQLDESQRALLQRALALGLAYDHDAEAVDFFDLPESALDPVAHEWRVRAALLHARWKPASQWLDRMPPALQQEPRWTYWRARALEQRGQLEKARLLYAEVAREREYYAFLAAERLGQKPELRPQALPEDPATRELLAMQPALVRARELFFCDLPQHAAFEFQAGLRDVPESIRPQAAALAASWGWHEPAIVLVSELGLWDDLWLRFPLPWGAEVVAAAGDTGIPADWIYMVLRTESLYNPLATSHAGAFGLLQLRLPTARQIARSARLPLPTRADLYRPDLNIALGARYLRDLQARYAGRLIYTLAAYNAGPHRLAQWLPKRPLPADVWVENIPYSETRAYVQRALSSLVMIGWRRNGEPTPLKPLLADLPAAAR